MLSPAELNRLAKDTGCDLHDDCLTCPLDECIFITGRVGARTVLKKQMYAHIRRMAATMPRKEIADQLGISLRTVERGLKE